MRPINKIPTALSKKIKTFFSEENCLITNNLILAFLLPTTIYSNTVHAKLADAQDQYLNTYESTQKMTDTQESEVCKRVLEWPVYDNVDMVKLSEPAEKCHEMNSSNSGTSEKPVGIYADYFSCDDIFALEKGEGRPSFAKTLCGTQATFDKWVGKIQKATKAERELQWFEDDTKKKLTQMSKQSDRTLSNAPYDLLNDLDEIDEVYFGERHTRPKPSFSFKKLVLPDVKGSVLGLMKEGMELDWQDGFNQVNFAKLTDDSTHVTMGGTTTNPNLYSEKDWSIASNLVRIKQALADGTDAGTAPLSGISQIAECNTTRIIQPSNCAPQIGKLFPDAGDILSFKTQKGPYPKSDPEVYENVYENIGEEFMGEEEKVFSETSCQNQITEDAKKYDVPMEYARFAIDECNVIKNEKWEEQTGSINKDSTMQTEKKYFQQILKSINQWNYDLSAWYYQMVMLKNEFRKLAEKFKCL